VDSAQFVAVFATYQDFPIGVPAALSFGRRTPARFDRPMGGALMSQNPPGPSRTTGTKGQYLDQVPVRLEGVALAEVVTRQPRRPRRARRPRICTGRSLHPATHEDICSGCPRLLRKANTGHQACSAIEVAGLAGCASLSRHGNEPARAPVTGAQQGQPRDRTRRRYRRPIPALAADEYRPPTWL